MRTNDITIYHRDQSPGLEITYCPPISRLATPWIRGYLGLFRVDVSVIGPITEQPEDDLTTLDCKFQDIVEAITDRVVTLIKKADSKYPGV